MQKNNKYQNNWRYAVWVGSVDDLFTDYDIAKKHYDKFRRFVWACLVKGED